MTAAAMTTSRALVLFSGGQDSTVALAWALERFDQAVETVGFDYGQRHRIELDCRLTIRERLPGAFRRPTANRLGPDHLLDLTTLGAISETALTRDSEITFAKTGLPTTFVPGRNLIFLSYAAAIAYRRDCRHIVLGVCETDYSGYPDCRDDTDQGDAGELSSLGSRPPPRAAYAADVARQGPDLRAGTKHSAARRCSTL